MVNNFNTITVIVALTSGVVINGYPLTQGAQTLVFCHPGFVKNCSQLYAAVQAGTVKAYNSMGVEQNLATVIAYFEWLIAALNNAKTEFNKRSIFNDLMIYGLSNDFTTIVDFDYIKDIMLYIQLGIYDIAIAKLDMITPTVNLTAQKIASYRAVLVQVYNNLPNLPL